MLKAKIVVKTDNAVNKINVFLSDKIYRLYVCGYLPGEGCKGGAFGPCFLLYCKI